MPVRPIVRFAAALALVACDTPSGVVKVTAAKDTEVMAALVGRWEGRTPDGGSISVELCESATMVDPLLDWPGVRCISVVHDLRSAGDVAAAEVRVGADSLGCEAVVAASLVAVIRDACGERTYAGAALLEDPRYVYAPPYVLGFVRDDAGATEVMGGRYLGRNLAEITVVPGACAASACAWAGIDAATCLFLGGQRAVAVPLARTGEATCPTP